MDEEWSEISDYPGYLISNQGRVYGKRTETILAPSMNSTGNVKVNLMSDGHIHTKSVRVLVAEAFLGVPANLINETPINLNGDPWDNRVENLDWRPRWFAWKYTRQFNQPIPKEYNVWTRNLKFKTDHETVMGAGIYYGEIWEYIYNSALTGRPTYPSGSTYCLVYPNS